MLRLVRVIAALAFVPATTPAVAAPLSAYSQLPAIEVTTVSPTGNRLALVVTDGEQRSVVVRDIKTRAIVARAIFGDVPVQALRWAGDDHVLITTIVRFDPPNVSGGLRDWRRLHVFDLAREQIRPLLDDAPDGMNQIMRAPMVRTIAGRPAVFVEGVQFVSQRGYAALYQADLDNGQSRIVQPAITGSIRWLVDHEGRPVARQVLREQPRRVSIEVRHGDDWREVHAADGPGERANLVSLGRDGRSVVYSETTPDEIQVWREVPLGGGSARLVDVPRGHGPVIDPQSGRLMGHAGWEGDAYVTRYFDPADDLVAQAMRKAYPAAYVGISSWSNDRKQVAALIDSSSQLPAYALYDHGAGAAGWIGFEYPGLTEGDVGPQTRIRFKAADGLELSGYLTRPPGRAQARGLPLVVLPHDGPDDRDTPGFDWMVQGIASRGYAVLQLNYRGSSDLGDALRKAGEGQMGRGMQTDLSQAVKLLAGSGSIDPERVCIAGKGYGGYAALSGVTLQPDVYRCAVAIGGFFELQWPSSWQRMPPEALAHLKRRLGVDGPDDPRLARYSPVKQAQSVRAPVLLVYGRNDGAGVAQQSERMAAALRKEGKDAEVVVLPDGDRRLLRWSAREGLMNALVRFLEKHNPPN